jgi:hypothetical protein
MSVRINLDSRFWDDPSGKLHVFEVQGKTVGECLARFAEIEPGLKPKLFNPDGSLILAVFLSVNQVPVFMNRMEKAVNDGDEIGLIYGGGS